MKRNVLIVVGVYFTHRLVDSLCAVKLTDLMRTVCCTYTTYKSRLSGVCTYARTGSIHWKYYVILRTNEHTGNTSTDRQTVLLLLSESSHIWPIHAYPAAPKAATIHPGCVPRCAASGVSRYSTVPTPDRKHADHLLHHTKFVSFTPLLPFPRL